MKLEDGLQLILKALEKRNEERAFQLYTTKYAWMDKKTFVSFEDFYKPPKHHEVAESNKTAEEILLDVKEMMNNTSWR